MRVEKCTFFSIPFSPQSKYSSGVFTFCQCAYSARSCSFVRNKVVQFKLILLKGISKRVLCEALSA